MTEVFDPLVIPIVVSKFRLPGKHILRWGFGFRELQYALWDNMLESKRNRIGQRDPSGTLELVWPFRVVLN